MDKALPKWISETVTLDFIADPEHFQHCIFNKFLWFLKLKASQDLDLGKNGYTLTCTFNLKDTLVLTGIENTFPNGNKESNAISEQDV
ncbi:unnamed protein product [Sphenostylis stenocarpa]|uniref:Uncharacterized protein n=1 Tax=Sphenostylis stenocarpa TaxID=92480 RepID=A0AA86T730_9FABA|nr:unnamed protein product [Sphenostylis stenocarpa]